MKKITLLVLFLIGSIATSYGQLSEDFEGVWPPAGWTIESTNTAFTWVDITPGINGTSAFVDYDLAQDESLITPVFTVPAGSPSLDFTMAMGYTFGVDPFNAYDFLISISTDGGGTWTQIWDETELGVFDDYDFLDVSIPLATYAGETNVKVKFQYVGDDGDILALDDVHVDIPPAAAPDCAVLTAPADAATGLVYWAPINLTWTAAATGATAASYDVYLDTNVAPTTLLGNQNTLTRAVTGLLASTTYYWKVISKNAAGDATGCSVFSFTTSANPFAPYCGPITFATNVEPITLVNFAGINNVTSAVLNGTPGHEDFISITGNVTAGTDYTITLQGNTDGTSFTNRFMVFADWNQDGDFEDTNEAYTIAQTITGSTGVDAIQATQSLTVPPTALAGTTRMRVKKIYGTTNYTDPCLGTGFGQVEEYSLNVTAASADLPDYVNLQYPASATIAMGDNVTVYAQVYEGGLTDVAPNIVGQAPGITAWVGISDSDTNPNTWTTWVPTTWNSGSVGNNDEYIASIGATLAPGTYYYATRFQLNGGLYVYGGINATNDGNFWDGTIFKSGVLTVNPPPPVEPNCDLVSSLPDDSLGGSVWTRPFSATALSSIGIDVSYHIYGPFTVDTDGSYTFTSTQDFDGFIFLYQNSFDPNDQLTNYVAGNDDSGPGSVITSTLTTGTTYYFITTAYEPGEFGDFSTDITGAGIASCGPLSVPGFNNNNFTYYPNPVKNTLNLSYDKEISNVEVFNLLGQKVASNKVNANSAQIDMSNLSRGAYMVKVTSNDQTKTIKVIKD